LALRERLLLVPLIGVMDAERAQHFTSRVLEAVRRERARVVVLDVTGVARMDAYVASALLRTVEAARLLGAKTVMTGITSEVAGAFIATGVDFSQLATVGDLRAGLQLGERLIQS
jgi:rsbT co-antagonist protein RsbR